MTKWTPTWQALHAEAQELYRKIVETHQQMERELKANAIQSVDMVDSGFLHREMEELLEDARKELKRRRDIMGAVLAIRCTEEFATNPTGEYSVKGELATAYPDVQVEPIIPRRGSPEYVALMKFLGLSEEAVEQGLVNIHFNHLKEYLTKMAEEGKNPPGILRTNNRANVTFRRKKAK